MCNMFSGCKSLTYLPDISNWDTSNIHFMDNIFEGCESLIYLAEI